MAVRGTQTHQEFHFPGFCRRISCASSVGSLTSDFKEEEIGAAVASSCPGGAVSALLSLVILDVHNKRSRLVLKVKICRFFFPASRSSSVFSASASATSWFEGLVPAERGDAALIGDGNEAARGGESSGRSFLQARLIRVRRSDGHYRRLKEANQTWEESLPDRETLHRSAASGSSYLYL